MWHPRTKTLLISAILLALYNDWTLGPIINSRASMRYSLISELSARTQPYHWAFQTLDILAGIVTLLMLPWLWKFLQKFDVKYSFLLFITIASIGADSIVDALLPISCAPTIDAQCSLMNTHSLLTDAHLIESTAIGIATFIAPLLWWWSCKAKQQVIARGSIWFVALQIFVGGGILAGRALGYNDTGIFQRAYELGIGLWVVGILYIALMATAKQRVKAPQLKPTPTPALSYSE
jgi:hypothetical protein